MKGGNENRNALVAAAVILLAFGAGAYYMPKLMLAVGRESPAAAGLVAIAFVAAFFFIFWLRSKRRGGNDP